MQSLLVVCHHLMSIYDPYNFQTCICPTRALFFVNIIKSFFLVHFGPERQVWTTSVWTGPIPTGTDRFETESNRTDTIGPVRSICISRTDRFGPSQLFGPIGPVQMQARTEDRPIWTDMQIIHIKDGMQYGIQPQILVLQLLSCYIICVILKFHLILCMQHDT